MRFWPFGRRSLVVTGTDVVLLTAPHVLSEQEITRLRAIFDRARLSAQQGDGPTVVILDGGITVGAILRSPWPPPLPAPRDLPRYDAE